LGDRQEDAIERVFVRDSGRRVERLAWAHDFSKLGGVTNAQLSGPASVGFTALSSQIVQDSGVIELSASGRIADHVNLFADYHVEDRTRQLAQSVQFGLRAQW